MADYMNGQLELVETQRKAGKNDVGMVAWLMTLKTVECPTVSYIWRRNPFILGMIRLYLHRLRFICFVRGGKLS